MKNSLVYGGALLCLLLLCSCTTAQQIKFRDALVNGTGNESQIDRVLRKIEHELDK